MNFFDKIEVEPSKKANSTVIWLHGLGADGSDFEPIIAELKLPSAHQIRFIFPEAPKIPVSVNGGILMPAWYDILEMTSVRKINESQLISSANKIHSLIDRELERGIDSENIIIAGFSQGGAVALQAGLTYPKSLSGILAMSSYFAATESIDIARANQSLPIQFFHGIYDTVISEDQVKSSLKKLVDLGLKPEYKSYLMDHSVCLEEISDISKSIQEKVGRQF